jgi:hypothetical protein
MTTSLVSELERACGKPEYLVTVDFETYYSDDFTLSKMTTADYIRDPRFEEIGCGVKIRTLGGPDTPPKRPQTHWLNPVEFRRWAASFPWHKAAFLAHHTHFDGLIASWHHGVRPLIWLDTLSMARALHGTEVGNSLAKLMLAYGVGEKGKYVAQAKGKRLADFSPAEYAEYAEYCKGDVEGCEALFYQMVRKLPEVCLWSIDTTIRMFTDPCFRVNEPRLSAYLVHERARKAELLDRVAKDKSFLLSNDKFVAILEEMGVEPPQKISPRTGKLTWALAKTDPGMQELLEHERDEVRWLAEARVGIKSTINETRTERVLRAGKDGKPLCVYLKWAGAHTFRWSGGDRMNMQNLERAPGADEKKCPNTDQFGLQCKRALGHPEDHEFPKPAGVLRRSLQAAHGHILVVADSSQVEARVTGWLAGHQKLLAAFAKNNVTGGDIYADFGTDVFQRPISKKTTPIERQLSKNMVLGLGFGMGWRKFATELLKGMLGSDPVQFTEKDAAQFNVDVHSFAARFHDQLLDMCQFSRLEFDELVIHCAVANYFVQLYRDRNPEITGLWKFCNTVLLPAMADGQEVTFGPGNVFKTIRHGLVLPNGMVMRYPGLRYDGEGYSYMGGRSGKERVRAYGGSITENIVQAAAKIAVEEEMLLIRAFGEDLLRERFKIPLMTHDEVVAHVPGAHGKWTLDMMLGRMRAAPEWAPTLPIWATGDMNTCYGDAK